MLSTMVRDIAIADSTHLLRLWRYLHARRNLASVLELIQRGLL